MANEQNLTPFKKGHPGMGGRPKGSISVVSWLKKALEAEIVRADKDGNPMKRSGADWVAISLMNKAIRGDVPAIREIMDRIDGKVPQTSILQGDEEGGAMRYELKNVSKEQVDAIVRIGDETNPTTA